MSDVFISYKRENLAAVGRLVTALRSEGVGVWWDQDIPPNAAWEATIEQALAAAKLVIVAWSPAAVASENVKAEARWARAQGRLLQVFVEPCEPPLFFGERQGVDLKAWSGAAAEPVFQTLLQTVRDGSAGPPAPAGLPPPAPAIAANAPPLPSKPSIAVMPFANLSSDPEQVYFADGMAEEISTALSRYASLFVISSGSSLTFRDSARSLHEIAEILGVRYVLEGSVRKSGERVRITVKLTDAVAAMPIWSDRFDGDLKDVFDLQDAVAVAAARQIEPNIKAAEERRAASRTTADTSAYDLMLRSNRLVRSNEPAGTAEALALARAAVALDPTYAYALAMAGFALSQLIAVFDASINVTADRVAALDYGARALRADSGDPEVVARVFMMRLTLAEDIPGASILVERALAAHPGSAQIWNSGGWAALWRGAYEQAIERFETATRLDPCSSLLAFNLWGAGSARVWLERYEEAEPQLAEAMQLRPTVSNIRINLALAQAMTGKLDAARRTIAGVHREPVERWLLSASERPLVERFRRALAQIGVDV